MPKKIVQDIVVPNKRRSIKNIEIERNDDSEEEKPIRKSKRVTKTELEEDIDLDEVVFVKKPEKKPKQKFSPRHLMSFIIIILSVVVIAIAFSLSYSKAIVTITPKIVNLDIGGTYTAKKDSANDLSYEVVTSSLEATTTLKAIKGSLIQTKAKGIFTIYNKNTTSQVLVAGTRLSSPDGLIFRTSKTVTVPAKKTNPGSMDVTAVADKAGSNYNLLLSENKYDFKLPGYSGTDKYDKFYSKLKSSITGGYSGNKITIDVNAKNEAIKELETDLRDKLQTKIESVVPKDYTYYNSANTIKFDVQEPRMIDSTNAELIVRGTIFAPIFKTDSLVKSLAGTEARKFPSDTYSIKGDKDLVFKLSNSKDFSAERGTSMIFTLKGNISIVGALDENKLKEELKGIKLSESNAIYNKYGAISSAYSLITPFWLRSFPDSIEKIKIEYK